MARPIKCNFKGENNGNVKLSPADVKGIILLYSTGQWTYQRLADVYGVNKSHIYRIINRKAWTVLGL